MSLVRLVAALVMVQFTGTLAATCLLPGRGAAERWIWGGTIGLAALVYAAVLCAYLRIELIALVWPVALIGLIVWWRRLKPRPALIGRGADMGLAIVLAAVAVPRLVVAFAHDLPPGWDPTFHLVLARKILEAGGMIYDWKPFEDIALNYPVGSHVLVAVLAGVTRLPLQTVFNLLIPLIGILTTAQVFLLARSATRSAEIGRYAAVAYGLWANWGSLDYYRWGGLPNVVAMLFFMGLLTLLVERPAGRLPRLLLGLFAASLGLSHHHVMLTAGVVLVAVLVFDTLAGNRDRRWLLLSGLGVGAVLASPYLVPYALKARGLADTSVLNTEPLLARGELLPAVGAVFALFAVLGMVLALARMGPRPAAPVAVAAATLAGLFLLFEYVVPDLSARWYHDTYIAFTPSRFLTDLAYVAAVFAGGAVYWLRTHLRVAPAAALVAALLLGATQYSAWTRLYTIPTVDARLWEAYQWIQAHTAPDAIVLDRGRWSVFGTWRRTAATSVPVSEPATLGTPKQLMIEALESGTRPPEATAEVVGIRNEPDAGGSAPVLWRHPSGLVVVELWPPAVPAAAGRR